MNGDSLHHAEEQSELSSTAHSVSGDDRIIVEVWLNVVLILSRGD